jgi:hypothetical protein
MRSECLWYALSSVSWHLDDNALTHNLWILLGWRLHFLGASEIMREYISLWNGCSLQWFPSLLEFLGALRTLEKLGTSDSRLSLPTWKVDISRILIQGQSGQRNGQTHFQKNQSKRDLKHGSRGRESTCLANRKLWLQKTPIPQKETTVGLMNDVMDNYIQECFLLLASVLFSASSVAYLWSLL